jgi:hypothetical protein
MGLVARYLFSAEARRGLIVRWDPAMTATDLAGAIESMKASLRLRQPKRHSRKKDDSGSKAAADKAYNDRARRER